MNLARRFLILQRDGFACLYCGRKAPEVVLEVDHLVPRAAGGSNHPTNLVTACRECNAGKTDAILPEQVIEALRRPIPDRKNARSARPRTKPSQPIRRARYVRPAPSPEVSVGVRFTYDDEGRPQDYICVYCGNHNAYESDVCSCYRRIHEPESVDICWDCGRDLTDYEAAEFDDVCEDCYAASHRVCETCDEPLDGDECPSCEAVR